MSLFQTDKILSDLKLFWQYPVITEKTFYQQNKDNEKYIGFPWATIIDKRYDLNVMFNLMKSYIRPNVQYFTCCQHISFRNLIPLFKALGIHTVYTPHKILTEDKLSDIQLRSCPLYAVNIEDNNRNLSFSKCEPLKLSRKFLYSFQGAYHPSWYLTDIRKRIFEMKHPDNCYVNHIGNWHFENVVYNKLQNSEYELNETDSDHDRTTKYNKLLLDSRYSLCPSGSGPNSIRFWESLAVGSIPVLLADTLELPPHELWDKAIVRIPEKKLEERLLTTLSSISEDQEREMRENCMNLYKYFKDNYIDNSIPNKTILNNSISTMNAGTQSEIKSNTIFTSYKCDIKDTIIQKILNKWKLLNPTINVLYFSDNDVDAFFKDTKYYDVYKNMRNGVAIADFFRICYINKYGGYWFDLDISPLKLKLPEEGNIHLFDCGYKNISYMFIGGNPNQQLFNDVIQVVVDNINKNIIKKKDHIMEITGPRIIQNIIFNKLNIKNKDGCLAGSNNPTKYLINTEYEFIYTLLHLSTTKTDDYKLLQKNHKQLSYGHYDYV
tara:strand:+ start:991 stop:2640 length:1650 start_codon:yes stop_codon:yes gene_type:complete